MQSGDLLPKESDPQADECARPDVCLYGCKDANQRFELTVGEKMTAGDFKQGSFSPCLFAHKTKPIRCFVHGDDFVLLATMTLIS